MKFRLFAALLLVAGLAVSVPVKAAVLVPGALTTSDHYATDNSEANLPEHFHFYYDLYKVTNTSAFNVTLSITLDPDNNLKPFLGYTFNLGVLPSSNWDNGSPSAYDAMETMSSENAGETISFGIFSPTLNAGASLLVAVTTWDYVEDPGFQLDEYLLTLDGTIIRPPPPCEVDCGPSDVVVVGQDGLLLVEQILPAAVPAPFTPALLLIGLAGLALTRRRATA